LDTSSFNESCPFLLCPVVRKKRIKGTDSEEMVLLKGLSKLTPE